MQYYGVPEWNKRNMSPFPTDYRIIMMLSVFAENPAHDEEDERLWEYNGNWLNLSFIITIWICIGRLTITKS